MAAPGLKGLLEVAVLAALAMSAHAFTGGAIADLLLRRSRVPCPALCAARGCDCSPAAVARVGALPDPSRLPRSAALRKAATAAATAAAVLASASPAFAGTVMVGGAAVDAEEETEDEAYEALDDAPGPLDALLAKVNFKKLGVAGGAFLLADIVSGLVMGRSFLKIVSGNADPNDWKTKVVDKYYQPGDKGGLDLGARAKLDSVSFSDPVAIERMVQDKIAENKVMVFSKTNCPFCRKAKKALDEQGIPYQTMELDSRGDGADIQDLMQKMTGGRTVPRVFVGGKFVGGGDDTVALAASGELKRLFESA